MNSRTQGANSLEELLTPLYDMERGFRDWWAEKGVGRGLLQDSMREIAHQAWMISRERYAVPVNVWPPAQVSPSNPPEDVSAWAATLRAQRAILSCEPDDGGRLSIEDISETVGAAESIYWTQRAEGGRPPVCRGCTPESSPCAAVPFLRLAILREVLGAASLADYSLANWIRQEIAKEEKRGGTP